MIFLAGFCILLHRYTARDEFLIGSASFGRHRPETHDVVGFFVDTFVLRADVSGAPTARQMLERVRKEVIDAIEHSEVPFERVVDTMDLPRDPSRHPLFQVSFNAPPQFALELDGLEVSPLLVNQQVSRFDLEITYSDGAHRPMRVNWNSDLFEAATIARMFGHYLTLLEGIARDPDQPVSNLPLLAEAERNQLLSEWNNTHTAYPRELAVHQLFETQVARNPDSVALACGDKQSRGDLR
jgi:non-ribosomal peptide synthetase component F